MTALGRILQTPARRFIALAGVLTALRIVSLILSDTSLGPDEGQYWFWSTTPAFGYFSKPPMVAWSIGAMTALFGPSEWAVRLASPLYQLGTAVFLYLLARRLAGEREAFWSGAAWLTLPGTFLSSALITTDAPLLFFWSMALYLFFMLTDPEKAGDRRGTAILLGCAIGLGFLSKYAMTYFVIGGAVAIAGSATRRRIGLANALISLLVALLILAPNVAWNAVNDFQTIAHTAANADWSGDFGHPDRLLKFFGDQFAIAGPIMLILIIAAVFNGREGLAAREREIMRSLLVFALPAIIIVSAQAFISRAHGNWAAVAYPSAIVMATIFAVRRPAAFVAARASVALHVAIGLGFLAAFSSVAVSEAIGAGGAFKKIRGWETQGAAIAALSRDFDAIMTDDREITGALVYYARNGAPIVAWNSNKRIDSHFEAFHLYDPQRDRRVLYVTSEATALYIKDQFQVIDPIRSVDAEIGGGRIRTLYLFEVSGPVAGGG